MRKRTLLPPLLLAGLCFLFGFSPLYSQGISSSGVQFLKIPVGVRGAGMGGTFEAVADDVSTLFWNSAGLAQIQRPEINLYHLSYFQDMNFEFAGAALPLGAEGVLGFGASFDSTPSFNSTNNPLEAAGSAGDLAVALAYGRALGEHLSLGIGGKFLLSNLLTTQAVGGAMDAGALFYTKDKAWTLGLSIQNLGRLSAFTASGPSEQTPLVYRVGLAYRFQPKEPTRFLIGLDLEAPQDGEAFIHAGAEAWVGNKKLSAAARGGYAFGPSNGDLGGLSGASLGAGLRVEEFEVDYAWVPFGFLGDSHRVSLTYRFGSEYEEAAEKVIGKLEPLQIQPEGVDLKEGTLARAVFNLGAKLQARTEIKNWTFEIKDSTGTVIRVYAGKGVPPKELVWDGKDSKGNVVPRALFASYNFRTVDQNGRQGEAEDPIFTAQKAEEEPSPRPPAFKAPELSASIQPQGFSGILRVPDVYFEEKSSGVNPAYFDYLAQVAGLIRRYPNARVYVEGHASREGDATSSLRLSQERADVVLRYLVEKGKVSPRNLYARGHGASETLDAAGGKKPSGRTAV